MFHVYVPAFLGAALCGILAVSTAAKREHTLAQWAFSLGMLLLGMESAFNGLAARSTSVDSFLFWEMNAHLAKALLPVAWIPFGITYARGNARQFFSRWRMALIAAFCGPFLIAILDPRHLVVAAERDANDNGWHLLLSAKGVVVHIALLLGSLVVLMDLERTYRASVGLMRWRIKFLLLGLAVLFVARVYSCSQVLVFAGLDSNILMFDSLALVVSCVLIIRSLFRPGLFDRDVYPSQSAIFGSVVAVLAGTYLVLVGITAKLTSLFGSSAQFSLRAFFVLVSIVALAVALQSDRLRMGLRIFVSRHFQRPLFDYRVMWKRFAEGTSSCATASALCTTGVRLVVDNFELLSASIWLIDDSRESIQRAAASFSSNETPSADGHSPAVVRPIDDILRHFAEKPAPQDLDSCSTGWAAALKQGHPTTFRTGGHRVGVPISGRNELLGLLVIGDRISGTPFSPHDIDMLRCVGDQFAAGLLNARLAKDLLLAREFEAFQTMATFFVHDLKNSANTLNLLLQNLPEHFNDPEFRADALRGCAKTVTHINDLVARLGTLRQGLTIEAVERDLNEVVTHAITSRPMPPGARLKIDLRASERVMLDPEQIHRVLTNLIFNAQESLPNGTGEIEIHTGEQGNWSVISVSDTGCGISPDFIRSSLFRPFQTTKKHGLGIGMFQSKMIVQAHHGRMEVRSEVGRGSTFRVLLPRHTPGT